MSSAGCYHPHHLFFRKKKKEKVRHDIRKEESIQFFVSAWPALFFAQPLSADEPGTSDDVMNPSLEGPDAIENLMESRRTREGVRVVDARGDVAQTRPIWGFAAADHATATEVDRRRAA
jgi:hypothetical protein